MNWPRLMLWAALLTGLALFIGHLCRYGTSCHSSLRCAGLWGIVLIFLTMYLIAESLCRDIERVLAEIYTSS